MSAAIVSTDSRSTRPEGNDYCHSGHLNPAHHLVLNKSNGKVLLTSDGQIKPWSQVRHVVNSSGDSSEVNDMLHSVFNSHTKMQYKPLVAAQLNASQCRAVVSRRVICHVAFC